MSTTTLEKPIAKDTDKEPVLLYELVRRIKSSWKPNVKKGNTRMKDISTAKWMTLDVRSRYNGGPGVGMVEIQYVPGAPTIRRNDYVDAGGNQQKGLISLYGREHLDIELFKRASMENLRFVDGIFFLDQYGGASNTILLEFISHHEMNQAAPNFKVGRNHNTLFLFKPLEKEKKATADLDTIEMEMNAMSILNSLFTKKGENTTYDTAKINAILGLLQEGGGLGSNESGQKVLLIRSFVHKNPAGFLKAYNDTIEEYGKTVKLATQFKVLTISGKEAVVKITSQEPQKIELKSAKYDENVEALIFHFLGTPDGDILFSQMQAEIENQRIEALKK